MFILSGQVAIVLSQSDWLTSTAAGTVRDRDECGLREKETLDGKGWMSEKSLYQSLEAHMENCTRLTVNSGTGLLVLMLWLIGDNVLAERRHQL